MHPSLPVRLVKMISIGWTQRKYEPPGHGMVVLIPETNGAKCRLLTIMSASHLLIKPPCTSVLQLAELLCEFNP